MRMAPGKPIWIEFNPYKLNFRQIHPAGRSTEHSIAEQTASAHGYAATREHALADFEALWLTLQFVTDLARPRRTDLIEYEQSDR